MDCVRIITNKDKDFYSLLGPFLAKREISKELGSFIYDDDNKIWFVYRNKIFRRVFGFASIFIYKNVAHLRHVYTLPEYRRLKVNTSIFDEIIRFCQHNRIEKIKSTVTPMGINLHKNFGFREISKLGKYTKMERTF